MSNPFDLAFDAVVPPPAAPAAKVERPAAAKPAAKVAAPAQADDDQAARRAEMQRRVDAIEDGIYFGLPSEIYHAVPRLSASGLQKLCVSAATFWRRSWLDPDRAELDEEATAAQVLGKAYHTARLEPELFDQQYVRALEKSEFPKATLFTGTDMGKALEALGEKKTGSVGEQAQRLVDAGYEGPIWQIALQEWEAARGDRIALPGKYFDQIATDMEQIRSNDEIAALLTGGAAEVSIFWTDKHGLRMKARMDYLRADMWDDLKTFANPNGKELEQAIADTIRYNRYHVQAVTYRDAAEAIRLGGLQIIGEATERERAIVAAIQIRPDELACWYVFKEKDGVPNLLAYEFDFFHVPEGTAMNNAIGDDQGAARQARVTRRPTDLYNRAIMDIDRAKRSFVLHSQAYEPGEPWFPIEAKRSTSALDFSTHWLEGH